MKYVLLFLGRLLVALIITVYRIAVWTLGPVLSLIMVFKFRHRDLRAEFCPGPWGEFDSDESLLPHHELGWEKTEDGDVRIKIIARHTVWPSVLHWLLRIGEPIVTYTKE